MTTSPSHVPAGHSTAISAVVADPDALARRRVVRLLRAERDLQVTETPELDLERARHCDLLVLDAAMADLADALSGADPDSAPLVVVLGDRDELAARAFRLGAVDFLPKPVVAGAVELAVRRVRERLRERQLARTGQRLLGILTNVVAADGAPASQFTTSDADPLPAAARPRRRLDRIPVRSADRVFFVRADDVDWFEAEGNYVLLHVGGAVHQVRGTLASLAAALDPSRFARIHRRTIVNVDRVRELKPWFTGDYRLMLRDGTELRLSRTFRDELQSRLLG